VRVTQRVALFLMCPGDMTICASYGWAWVPRYVFVAIVHSVSMATWEYIKMATRRGRRSYYTEPGQQNNT